MNSNDLKAIEKAAFLCEQNPPETQKHTITAFVANKKGVILSYGMNSYEKTHPIQARYAELTNNKEHIYLHAEIAALVKNKSKKAKKMYIVRLFRNGQFADASPCPICIAAIKEAGIQKIIYTVNDGIKEEKII